MALFLAQGSAVARSIKDCDKIQGADAYNLCLASFGPVAHEHALKPVPAGIGIGRAKLRRHGHRHRHRHTVRYRHHGHKRMHMTVTPQVVRR
ncbi:MAG: hypothetical protein EPN75_02625 [Beijerinckiaceae bacterium]|nr:MAG: hypothetical protein EPN75_02625 [Beijerinckiaceae bacterium]